MNEATMAKRLNRTGSASGRCVFPRSRQLRRWNNPPRVGSAVVLSFLAMAVMSLAAISIVRSHRRANVRAANVRHQVEGRLIAEGLIHRNVALAKTNGVLPVASLDAELSNSSFPDAWVAPPVIDTTNETVSLQVYMYPGAIQPAATVTTSIATAPPTPSAPVPVPSLPVVGPSVSAPAVVKPPAS
ncbi:hypothetical protein [Rhodopirellula bahusiensis]|uniref:hypothetical protein n=1 Tax=Rhodopirellula bahusiensis TaxID=2014065 RepID=UPI003262F925